MILFSLDYFFYRFFEQFLGRLNRGTVFFMFHDRVEIKPPPQQQQPFIDIEACAEFIIYKHDHSRIRGHKSRESTSRPDINHRASPKLFPGTFPHSFLLPRQLLESGPIVNLLQFSGRKRFVQTGAGHKFDRFTIRIGNYIEQIIDHFHRTFSTGVGVVPGHGDNNHELIVESTNASFYLTNLDFLLNMAEKKKYFSR